MSSCSITTLLVSLLPALTSPVVVLNDRTKSDTFVLFSYTNFCLEESTLPNFKIIEEAAEIFASIASGICTELDRGIESLSKPFVKNIEEEVADIA